MTTFATVMTAKKIAARRQAAICDPGRYRCSAAMRRLPRKIPIGNQRQSGEENDRNGDEYQQPDVGIADVVREDSWAAETATRIRPE